jgi:predicted MFS family arabinose efflux permease
LSTASQGNIVQTDAAATASGNFQAANGLGVFHAAIAGGYVFDFKGVEWMRRR